VGQKSIERRLADEAATIRFGEDIGAALRPGDLVALEGDLGAGKTTFARGLIRSLAGSENLDVPSPTFTLVQVYDLRPRIYHFDLYRLSDASELSELGLDEALADGVALVEWPSRADQLLPQQRITITLTHDGSGRLASVDGTEDALTRTNRSLQAREFLDDIGWENARRSPLTGDASARAYETVTRIGEEPRILMNSPRLVLGPPVRDGKPYAEIAHTAQSITAFVAIARLLKLKGFAAPEIQAFDFDQGFALIENLGDQNFLDADGKPVPNRYAAAASLLADMHTLKWPNQVEAAPGVVHTIPLFDRAAMQIEADLLLDWYLPAVTGTAATDDQRREYALAWAEAFAGLEGAEFGLMQRDFHSPNIIWRESRRGNDRLGIVDFQDALIGPLAYDLASLAMDARVTVSPELERQTVSAYLNARERDAAFSRAKFEEAYAIMAAQRNAKILGIFVRLDRRDGKPAYLKHLPRIRDYLRRALAHPSLSRLKAFTEENGVLAEHRL